MKNIQSEIFVFIVGILTILLLVKGCPSSKGDNISTQQIEYKLFKDSLDRLNTELFSEIASRSSRIDTLKFLNEHLSRQVNELNLSLEYLSTNYKSKIKREKFLSPDSSLLELIDYIGGERKLVFSEDSLVKIDTEQIKLINSSFISQDYFHTLSDSLFSIVNLYRQRTSNDSVIILSQNQNLKGMDSIVVNKGLLNKSLSSQISNLGVENKKLNRKIRVRNFGLVCTSVVATTLLVLHFIP